MKAVLEFTYPQDEGKLKHALKGEEYYLALVEIDRAIVGGGNPELLLDLIQEVTLKALHE
jgi:disulfide oxidoreductase YuzD